MLVMGNLVECAVVLVVAVCLGSMIARTIWNNSATGTSMRCGFELGRFESISKKAEHFEIGCPYVDHAGFGFSFCYRLFVVGGPGWYQCRNVRKLGRSTERVSACPRMAVDVAALNEARDPS